MTADRYRKYIREVPDFPRPGINFKDISPLLQNGSLFAEVVEQIADHYRQAGVNVDKVAGPEARGFIFGAAIAYKLGAGLIPIRKPGKLPHRTAEVEYSLEYGTDKVEMHVDAVEAGQKVLLVDDLLATGGTVGACAKLLQSCGADLVGCAFLVELTFLNGRKKLDGLPILSLIEY